MNEVKRKIHGWGELNERVLASHVRGPWLDFQNHNTQISGSSQNKILRFLKL